MILEKRTLPPSIKEITGVILFGFVFINTWGYIVFTMIMDIPFVDLIFSYWSFLFLIPVAQGLILASLFRNAQLVYISPLKEYSSVESVSILLCNAGYCCKSDDDNGILVYDTCELWRKPFFFLRKKIVVTVVDNYVILHGKEKAINSLELLLSYSVIC
ncbi:MAG: hypothetical protein N4A72_13910 [Bacteroidales bacterium]|jgi:hypothetical protein|nr:hypothetical protein [Bacteroidales bacterium]